MKTPSHRPDKRLLICLAAIQMLGVLLLTPLLFDAEFVYDDGAVISKNLFPRSMHRLPYLLSPGYYLYSGEKTYRPLVTFSYFIDYALYGLDPRGYRAAGIMLHAATGFILGLLAFYMSRSRKAALFAAAMFAYHGVLLETIACAGYREDLFAAMFSFGAVCLVLAGAGKGRPLRMIFGVVVLSAAALLSKETAVVIPLILGAVTFLAPDVLPRKRAVPVIAATCLTVACFLLLWFVILPSPVPYASDAPPLWERLRLAPSILAWHIRMSILPVPLSVEHPVPGTGPGAWVIVFVFIVLWVLSMRHNKPAALGLTWFIIALSPVLNVFPALINPVAERYLYLPFGGFAVAAGAVFAALLRWVGSSRRSAGKIIAGVWIAWFIVLPAGIRQCRLKDWRNNLTLWRRALEIAPDSARANMNYALALEKTAHDDIGAWRALQKAHALDPESVLVVYNMGLFQHRKGRLKEAERFYRQALEMNPDHSGTLSEYGKLLCSQGRFEEARSLFTRGLRIYPGDPRFQRLLISIAPYLSESGDNAP